MSLINFPKTLKYKTGDRVWRESESWIDYTPNVGGGADYLNARSAGYCRRVLITGWRTVVEYAADGIRGKQTNYYTCKDIVAVREDEFRGATETTDDAMETYGAERDLPESKLFSSENHLLGFLRGGYINGSGNDAAKFFRTWGQLETQIKTFGDWADVASMNFQGARFDDAYEGGTLFLQNWSGNINDPGKYYGSPSPFPSTHPPASFVDNCDFTNAQLGSTWDTKAEFRAAVRSYDNNSTIWLDGIKIGRAITGVGAGTGGASTLTGSGGAQFQSQLMPGDVINIADKGEYTVASIESQTSLTIVGVFSAGNFTTKGISLSEPDN